ncbi:hypothetical protein FNF27_07217 [Cafeteria roenbergensis]|nr:hypothetical protein FNF27_07217 [Cafeteria roenbergensis]
MSNLTPQLAKLSAFIADARGNIASILKSAPAGASDASSSAPSEPPTSAADAVAVLVDLLSSPALKGAGHDIEGALSDRALAVIGGLPGFAGAVANVKDNLMAPRPPAGAAGEEQAGASAAAGSPVAASPPPPPPASEPAQALAATAAAAAATAASSAEDSASPYDDDDLHSRHAASPFRGQLEQLADDEEDSGHPAADDAEDIPVRFEEMPGEEFEAIEAEHAADRRMQVKTRAWRMQHWQEARAAAAEAGAPAPPLPEDLTLPPDWDPSILEAEAAAREAASWMLGKEDAAAAAAGSSAFVPPRSPWSAPWPGVHGKDEDGQPARFSCFKLRVVYEAGRTGFAEDKDFRPRVGQVIAGRFLVTKWLGQAAFSQAVAATDMSSGLSVCLKIVKNNKEYLDQSLDEVKLLEYANRRAADVLRRFHRAEPGAADRPSAEAAEAAGRVLRLVDFFYYKEHLFIVTELLKDNLYDWQKFVYRRGLRPFFTLPRVQAVAKQVLAALSFVHGIGILHCDLKPENLLLSSYSRCRVKLIDFGSSCFVTDHLTSYIQSRSYRAPEVILGLPYGPKLDVWSLGCILYEMATGRVLFVNDSVQTILARMQSVLGPIPDHMIDAGKESAQFFSQTRCVFEASEDGDDIVSLLHPEPKPLEELLEVDDPEFVDFLSALLTIDPVKRPTAAEALEHPFMKRIRDFKPYELPADARS